MHAGRRSRCDFVSETPQHGVNVAHLPSHLGVTRSRFPTNGSGPSVRKRRFLMSPLARVYRLPVSQGIYAATRYAAPEAIDEAVAALAYRPSVAARSLQSGVTRTIAVVVPASSIRASPPWSRGAELADGFRLRAGRQPRRGAARHGTWADTTARRASCSSRSLPTSFLASGVSWFDSNRSSVRATRVLGGALRRSSSRDVIASAIDAAPDR
jgi:hypothetical protein